MAMGLMCEFEKKEMKSLLPHHLSNQHPGDCSFSGPAESREQVPRMKQKLNTVSKWTGQMQNSWKREIPIDK